MSLNDKVKEPANKKHLEYIRSLVPYEMFSGLRYYPSDDMIDDEFIDGDYDALVRLHVKLKQAMVEQQRTQVSYDEQIENAFFIEDLYHSKAAKDWKIHSNMKPSKQTRFQNFIEHVLWIWHVKLQPLCFVLLALVAILLSGMIVIAEMSILFKWNFTIFEDLFKQNLGLITANLISLVLLGYLSMCTYYGLFHLRFFSFYAMHPHRQTDAYSLIYSASYFTKLSAPLCFNFCNLLDINDTAFHKMIGAIDPIPIIGH